MKSPSSDESMSRIRSPRAVLRTAVVKSVSEDRNASALALIDLERVARRSIWSERDGMIQMYIWWVQSSFVTRDQTCPTGIKIMGVYSLITILESFPTKTNNYSYS